MEYKEYAKKRLRNEERIAVMTLDMLSRSFAEAVEALIGRIGQMPGFKRDLGMMRHICQRFVKEAVKDNPQELAEHIIRQSRDFIISVERRSPVRRMEC